MQSNMHITEIDFTRALPPEILSRIFVLCARGEHHDCTFLPFSSWLPAQITISHVCSTWRQLALETTELWTDVYIDDPFNLKENDSYQTWLSRAGSRPLRLGLTLNDDHVIDLEARVVETFWKIVNQVKHIKELTLEIYVEHLSQLKDSAENKFPHLERLDLRLDTKGSAPVPLTMPNFVIHTRNRDVTVSTDKILHDAPLLHELALPWDRLTSLDVDIFLPLLDYMTVLKRTSSLETCFLAIDLADVEDREEIVTLPSVCTMGFHISEGRIDRIISHFEFPNLINLSILSASEWTNDTYGTIKNRYNLHRLQALIISRCNLPRIILSSIILKDAPLLTHAAIPSVDDETINGISTGDLGQSLNALSFGCTNVQIGIVLEMVRKRSKLVTQGFGRDHLRQELEELPRLIREVHLSCGIRNPGQKIEIETRYGERLAELKHMGVKVWIV